MCLMNSMPSYCLETTFLGGFDKPFFASWTKRTLSATKKSPSCLSTPWVLPWFLPYYHCQVFNQRFPLLTTHKRAESCCHQLMRLPRSQAQAVPICEFAIKLSLSDIGGFNDVEIWNENRNVDSPCNVSYFSDILASTVCNGVGIESSEAASKPLPPGLKSMTFPYDLCN